MLLDQSQDALHGDGWTLFALHLLGAELVDLVPLTVHRELLQLQPLEATVAHLEVRPGGSKENYQKLITFARLFL